MFVWSFEKAVVSKEDLRHLSKVLIRVSRHFSYLRI